MAKRSLPVLGEKNWGDILNRYMAVSTDENGGAYTFETESEMTIYFDNSTIYKTLDHGKTVFIKSTGQTLK